MKKYDSLQEMIDDNAPEFVIEQVKGLIAGTTREVNRPGYKKAPHEPEVGADFQYWYGGSINILETVEDLKQVVGLEESQLPPEEQPEGSGGWATLYEMASHFDQAFYFPGREWAMIWMATNNNGGDSYFIPASAIKAAPFNNVEQSIILTHGEIVEENWIVK